MALNSGDMDREVVLQQLTETTGASGYPVEGWTELVTVWAQRLDATRNRSSFTVAQRSEPFDAEWRIYYQADMDPDAIDIPKKRRLVYEGRAYDIVAAALLGFNEGIALATVASSEVAAP